MFDALRHYYPEYIFTWQWTLSFLKIQANGLLKYHSLAGTVGVLTRWTVAYLRIFVSEWGTPMQVVLSDALIFL